MKKYINKYECKIKDYAFAMKYNILFMLLCEMCVLCVFQFVISCIII